MDFRNFAILAAFASVGACTKVGTTADSKSNYPPNYCEQTVRTFSEGPAVFALVGSGCYSGAVVAYKKSGILAKDNPERIMATIVSDCSFRGRSFHKQIDVVMQNRGESGFNSEPIVDSLFSNDCLGAPWDEFKKATLSIAYSLPGNRWDSRQDGNNYIHLHKDNTADPGVIAEEYNTRKVGSDVNAEAWNFIVNVMKK